MITLITSTFTVFIDRFLKELINPVILLFNKNTPHKKVKNVKKYRGYWL